MISIVCGRYERFICNFCEGGGLFGCQVDHIMLWEIDVTRDPNKCNIAVDCVESRDSVRLILCTRGLVLNGSSSR